MDKRGQVFIIAAIIVIALVAGLSGVVTYASAGDDQRAFYDLSEEVGFETKKVLDWGVFNDGNLDSLTEEFLFDYSNYIGEEEVVFVFGNRESLSFKALFFREENIGSVSLNTGDKKTVPISRRTNKDGTVLLGPGEVSVNIEGIEYDFDLRQGENFFFVIIKEDGENRYVAKG